MQPSMVHTFSDESQTLFARLSGDANPIHIDPVAARRLLYGRQVVHGIHVLLTALDRWIRIEHKNVALTRLTAKFLTPVFLDEDIEFCVTPDGADWRTVDRQTERSEGLGGKGGLATSRRPTTRCVKARARRRIVPGDLRSRGRRRVRPNSTVSRHVNCEPIVSRRRARIARRTACAPVGHEPTCRYGSPRPALSFYRLGFKGIGDSRTR